MRESRTYGSGRGACHEMHVPTATVTQVHHVAHGCTRNTSRAGMMGDSLTDRLAGCEIVPMPPDAASPIR